MNSAVIISVVQLATELAYAGVEISALIEEARANGGDLSQETKDRIKAEYGDARALWDRRTEGR